MYKIFHKQNILVEYMLFPIFPEPILVHKGRSAVFPEAFPQSRRHKTLFQHLFDVYMMSMSYWR